ncbi:MAG: flagellar basal body-associated FliL family protein [Treponema sp.]|jgi:flagellar basal body-associated protein FliL|nr:flagellar basal body-associated FliL family protein [Treponema sp.]
MNQTPKAVHPPEKSQAKPPLKGGSLMGGILYRILLILLLALILVLAGVTVYALVFRNGGIRPLVTLPRLPSFTPQKRQEQIPAGTGMFTGIGRFRVVTADSPPMTVVLSIAFPYAPEDRAFAEELDSKIQDFRNIASAYFSAHTAEELRQAHEDMIKAELLRRYNSILQLGQITVLYFNDFMLLF